MVYTGDGFNLNSGFKKKIWCTPEKPLLTFLNPGCQGFSFVIFVYNRVKRQLLEPHRAIIYYNNKLQSSLKQTIEYPDVTLVCEEDKLRQNPQG